MLLCTHASWHISNGYMARNPVTCTEYCCRWVQLRILTCTQCVDSMHECAMSVPCIWLPLLYRLLDQHPSDSSYADQSQLCCTCLRRQGSLLCVPISTRRECFSVLYIWYLLRGQNPTFRYCLVGIYYMMSVVLLQALNKRNIEASNEPARSKCHRTCCRELVRRIVVNVRLLH